VGSRILIFHNKINDINEIVDVAVASGSPFGSVAKFVSLSDIWPILVIEKSYD
jgi:hypothetical protein